MATSHTQRMEFMRCRRRWYYGYILGIEPEQDLDSLRMGRAFAICTEHGDANAADVSFDIALGQAKSQEEVNSLLLQRVQVQTLAAGYLARYPAPTHPVELEREVAINDPLLGRGRLDGVATWWADAYDPEGNRYMEAAQRVGIEDKLLTLAFWRSVDERALAYDPQVSAYFLGMRNAGTPLDKLEYRVTFKPGIKPSSREKVREDYTPQGLANYAARLRKKMAEEPEKFYRRYELYRSDEQLAEFEAEVKRIDADMKRSRLEYTRSKDLGTMYRNKQACSMYGGCMFQDICDLGPQALVNYRKKPERPGSQLQVDVLEAVARAFAPPQAGEVATILSVNPRSVPAALKALERRDLVVRGEGDTWTVTPTGARLAADR